MTENHPFLTVKGAFANNLKECNARFPLYKLSAITGVSGSGKSSLLFGVIGNEAHYRFWNSKPAYERLFAGKAREGKAESITKLPPVITLSQKVPVFNTGSTFGTVTGLYAVLRLLFARYGQSNLKNITINRSLFSFSREEGACSNCNGVGKVEEIDIDKLTNDSNKTLREGVLNTTLPNGYTIYSQVTIDALNMVCEKEGFSVDIPWNKLTNEQQNIVFYGSDKIQVPLGKHTLESRMKWTGMQANPQQIDFYKGMIPVMSAILKRDRNPSILKFTSEKECSSCKGKRLNNNALSVQVLQKNIVEWSLLSLEELKSELKRLPKNSVGQQIISKDLLNQINVLIDLGFEQATLNNCAQELTLGQIKRLKLAKLIANPISETLYLLDEPFTGVAPQYHQTILNYLDELISRRNTVILVEHQESILKKVDWVVELGPGGGKKGGEVLYEGLSKNNTISSFSSHKTGNIEAVSSELRKEIELQYSGQTSLWVNRKPIGKSSRSNVLTYTGILNKIRDLFAQTDRAKSLKFDKSLFSFNSKGGGACSNCEGNGYHKIGLHYIGDEWVVCEVCKGGRFQQQVLTVEWNGKNLAEVLSLTVDEALSYFKSDKKITSCFEVLKGVGLGYLPLGLATSNFSGGELQRVKLAAFLLKKKKEVNKIVFDLPSSGLADKDVFELMTFLHLSSSNKLKFILIDDHYLIHQNSNTSKGFQAYPIQRNKLDFVPNEIILNGCKTRNLKNFDLKIPKNKLVWIKGPSGSGKSALVYETLAALSEDRFLNHLNSYSRTYIQHNSQPDVTHASGLSAVIRLSQHEGKTSTLAKTIGLEDHFRLLFSRLISHKYNKTVSAGTFLKKKNSCLCCSGKGNTLVPDVKTIIKNTDSPLFTNGFLINPQTKYYLASNSRFVAIIKTILKDEITIDASWNDLSEKQKDIIWNGQKGVWDIEWEFSAKNNQGIERFKSEWTGVKNLFIESLELKPTNEKIKSLFIEELCLECNGTGYNKEVINYTFSNLNYSEWLNLTVKEFSAALNNIFNETNFSHLKTILQLLLQKLNYLKELGINTPLNYNLNSFSHSERQLLRLNNFLNIDLYGMTLVLDEPFSSLNEKQIKVVIDQLKTFRKNNNNILIIEHKNIQHSVDYIIEIGESSGRSGGSIVYNNKSINYSTEKEVETNLIPSKNLSIINSIKEATLSNNFVSYSKNNTISQLFHIDKNLTKIFIDKFEVNPAEFKPKSKNCVDCNGRGEQTIHLDFFQNVEEYCQSCQGTGVNKSVWNYKIKDKHIGEWMQSELTELCNVFPKLLDDVLIKASFELGLEYLNLNQKVKDLSGGEQKRIDLIMQTTNLNSKNKIILNTPYKGLDLKAKNKVINWLNRTSKKHNDVNFFIIC